MALGKQIQTYREARGWTQAQLSERSNVDVGTISALEVRDSARSKFAAPLARAFGLTVEQLLDESQTYPSAEETTAAGAPAPVRAPPTACIEEEADMKPMPTVGTTIVQLSAVLGALNDLALTSIRPLIQRALEHPGDLDIARAVGKMADAIAQAQTSQFDAGAVGRSHAAPVETNFDAGAP